MRLFVSKYSNDVFVGVFGDETAHKEFEDWKSSKHSEVYSEHEKSILREYASRSGFKTGTIEQAREYFQNLSIEMTDRSQHYDLIGDHALADQVMKSALDLQDWIDGDGGWEEPWFDEASNQILDYSQAVIVLIAYDISSVGLELREAEQTLQLPRENEMEKIIVVGNRLPQVSLALFNRLVVRWPSLVDILGEIRSYDDFVRELSERNIVLRRMECLVAGRPSDPSMPNE